MSCARPDYCHYRLYIVITDPSVSEIDYDQLVYTGTDTTEPTGKYENNERWLVGWLVG